MTIKQLLKSYPARITMYNRWLTIGGEKNYTYFTVREHNKGRDTEALLYYGVSESAAVEALIGNEE
jgi:hypothetical protein